MSSNGEVPAAIGQRLVWFLEHYRSEAASSVSCPAVFRIRGDFDEGRVQPALETLVARHESLRTTLARRGRDLVQDIHDGTAWTVNLVDLAEGAEDELKLQLGHELRASIPIDVSPIRFTLWRLGSRDRVLCVNMHHLVSDAWSCGVVINDVIELFRDEPALTDVGWQYRQFAQWQHDLAGTGALRVHQDYWNAKLQGLQLPVLPGRIALADVARPQAALATRELPGSLGDALRAFARAERATLFSMMLALYYVLLHRETGQSDVAVASFFANRTRREVQLTVGFLANMLALRTEFDPAGSFRELLGRVRRTVLDAVVHQAIPSQMLSLPSLLRSPGRLHDVVFQMLPDRSPDSWAPAPLSPGVEIDTFRPPQALSRFGLNLTIIPRGDRVDARLSYAGNQFEPGWAERFLADYVALASWVLSEPDTALTAAPPMLD